MPEHGSVTIEALIVNTQNMIEMFSDPDRLREGDFARKWQSFPASNEELQQTFLEIGIDGDVHNDYYITDYRSIAEHLDGVLPQLPDLDELNYLAARLLEMSPDERDVFSAVISSGRHSGSLKDLINIDHNLDNFYLQPAFDEEQYGEFLVDKDKDYHTAAVDKLRLSSDPELNQLADYVGILEECVDVAAYALSMIAEEQGVFTETGYLTETGEFEEIYEGPEDIPAEYQVFNLPEETPMPKVENTDLTAFLAKTHAIGGEYGHDLHYNLNVLEAKRSSKYLMLMSGNSIYLTAAANAYRRGTDAFNAVMNAPGNGITKAFALHVTDMHSGNVKGDIVTLDMQELQQDLLAHSIRHEHVDAVTKFGEEVSFAPEEWASLEATTLDKFENHTRHFSSGYMQAVIRHLENIAEKHAEQGASVEANTLLESLNEPYMKSADNPQPDMIRISREVAKDILTHGDAAVFRLLPKGAEQLSPLDAMASRGGLWYESYREFAVKKEDIGKLDKFADRRIDACVIDQKSPKDKPAKSNQ